MMLTAAMTSVLAAQLTKSVILGFFGGIAGAAAIGALFGFFTIVANADQIVTGTAINLLAIGATSVVYRETSEVLTRAVPRIECDLVVPLAWIIIPIALGLVVWNTTFGL